MEPKVLVPPGVEPISLARAREFLRIDVPGYQGDQSQDSDINSWIRAARQWCEKLTDTSIGVQTLMIAGDSFTDLALRPFGFGDPRSIILPRGPVIAIKSIDYTTSDGFESAVDPAFYKLTQMRPQRVVLRGGSSWPSAMSEPEAVRVIYDAGWTVPQIGTGAELYADNYADNYTSGPGALLPYDLPDDLIAAMRLMLGHFYRYRTAGVESAMNELPLGVTALLGANRSSIGV